VRLKGICERLLLFAFEYPPCYGGISRLCGILGATFAQHGIDAQVLTEARGEPRRALPSVVRLPSRRPMREWRAFQWLRQHAENRPVLCGVWYPEGLIAYLAGRRPLIILAHGAELLPPASRWRRVTWNALQRRVLESADLVIANSDYTRRLVEQVAPKARAQAIPLAVDTERFSPGDRDSAKAKLEVSGKTVLSTVSRICRYKGHEMMLEALAKLPAPERERLVYLIVGTGPYEQELRKRAWELGVETQVRWLGFVAENDLPEIYRASDLFVLCTRDAPEERAVEGFGLVFLEASACGAAVVGTRTGGIPDAVTEGEGGWLIQQDDIDALTEVIRNLVHCPQVFHEAGRRGQRRVLRECKWATYMQRFASALQSAGIDG